MDYMREHNGYLNSDGTGLLAQQFYGEDSAVTRKRLRSVLHYLVHDRKTVRRNAANTGWELKQ